MNIAGFKTLFYALCLLLLFYNCTAQAAEAPLAKNGLIDLRGQDLIKSAQLNGQWCFYWHQLLHPEKQPEAQGELVNFPFLWNGYKLKGQTLPAFGYATYTLTVLLPRNSGPLRMAIQDAYCAYKLFVNGRLAATNGIVADNPKDFKAHWEYRAFDLPAGVDTLKVVLQVANFVHSRGGVKSPILIGKKYVVELARQRAEGIDLLLTGCLLMGGLFFLGLYLFGNRDKAILLFSLYAMVFSYRIIGVDNYVLHTLLPGLDWYLTARLEYSTLFLGIALFGLYSRYLYPIDINKIILGLISTFCFVFAAMSLVLPPFYFTQLINPFLVVMVFCLVYIPYIYIKAWRHNRPGSIYALSSSLALMCVFAISLFHYWGLIPQLQLFSFVGYISFFFLQSLVLSHRVSFVLTQARQQAEQGFVAKSEFLSTMSHEIRTPLNSVIGMGYLLLENNPRPDQRDQLDVMIFSANNLLGIVNDILDYNKIEAGMITFEQIGMDLAGIAKNVTNSLQTVAQDKDIGLHLVVDEALTDKVTGDPTRISQVITNLVHNAIKFTNRGEVVVSLEVKSQAAKQITVRIQVKDTGIGISAEKQALIFERFTQADSSTSRSFGGTGLGLAISKRILELQHTELQLKSEVGKGSVFFFDQTFEKSTPVDTQQSPGGALSADVRAISGISILLVEDNALNVMVVKTFLKRRGAVIDVAANGQEALDKLDVDRHQLILMDLHMPVMDGYEAARKIRAMGITIPIIALTANLPHEVEEQVKQSGINDIVVKPFLPDELYRKVLHYIT